MKDGIGVYSQKQFEEQCALAKAGQLVAEYKDGQKKEKCVIQFWATKNDGIQPVTTGMPTDSFPAFKEKYPDAEPVGHMVEFVQSFHLAGIEHCKTRDDLLAFGRSLDNTHQPTYA